MRIERVVANSFAKASEQTRRLYGADCLILSTSNVGNITEVLVAVDDSANDEPVNSERTPVAATRFEENLVERLEKPIAKAVEFKKQSVVGDISAHAPSASNDSEMMGQGQVLVKAIRDELRALERRLASQQTSSVPMSMVNLLENGVSARYAERCLIAGDSADQLAAQLTADLGIEESTSWLQNLHAVVCGPVGAGKTTVVMQVAKASDATQVIGLKDTRIGARERFFALADRADLDGVWGLAEPPAGIIDSGALSPVSMDAMSIVSESQPALICLPAHVGRAAAAEWLRLSGPILGVIITHWNPSDVPLGLLTQLAESQIPLRGVSESADVKESLKSLKSSDIQALIARKLELVLYTDGVSG
jgi:hypothetical protein